MSHYFMNDNSLKNDIVKHNVILNNETFSFYTNHGVFSKKGLDFGTRTLLESISDISGDVLDMGCGYGPIGIYLKKMFDITCDMVDINQRSIDLSILNAKENEVDVNVFESDSYTNISKKYDYIISNPPIRIGKEKLYQMLQDAKKHLKKGGELRIVIHKSQGAESTVSMLEKYYSVNVEVKKKGFFVIVAKND